ncbi:MAG: hypothetical protein HYY64_10185 [Candidatus Rokubacteria bacterium]|nr:hypothetical protein [Candidatus Rokubacteria bacterium]
MKVFVIPLVAAALLVLGASSSAAGGTRIVIGRGHLPQHRVFATHPRAKIHVVPRTVYVIRSSPPSVRGYWTYQWIPQVYTSWAWIPGHYDPNGYWREGHYAPQTFQTGYYQPIWISGY